MTTSSSSSAPIHSERLDNCMSPGANSRAARRLQSLKNTKRSRSTHPTVNAATTKSLFSVCSDGLAVGVLTSPGGQGSKPEPLLAKPAMSLAWPFTRKRAVDVVEAVLGLVTVLVEVVAALASENENVVEELWTSFVATDMVLLVLSVGNISPEGSVLLTTSPRLGTDVFAAPPALDMTTYKPHVHKAFP